MSDLSSHLPLSQRARVDESRVSSDWSEHTSAAVSGLVSVLGSLDDDAWGRPSAGAGATVQDVAAELVAQLGAPARSPRPRVRDVIGPGRWKRSGAGPTTVDPPSTPAAITARLTELAGAGGSRGIRELSDAVLASCDIARAVGVELPIDPIASGAVALARSLSAPIGMRALLGERRLVAVDADWSVGAGREVRSTAAGIILFLFGRRTGSRGLPEEYVEPGIEPLAEPGD